MKKYVVIILLLIMTLPVQGQVLISLLLGEHLNTGKVEFGLEGGYNWSGIAGMEADKSLSTFNLGFYFYILVKGQWYVNTGVLVRSQIGVANLSENDLDFLDADVYDVAGDYAQYMKTFLVPVMVQYRFKSLFVELGPQVGVVRDGWVEFTSDVEGKDTRIREYNREKLNRLDAGVLAGVGYKIPRQNGLSFALKYYYGLTDVYKNRPGSGNRVLFLTMTAPVGANG